MSDKGDVMRQMELGQSGIMVPEWCLGTMTYGNQTPESDAHVQIDMSLDAGINFLDTAEMYPVNPVTAETAGRSEEIIGNWIARTGRRSDIILATKMAGPGPILRPGTLPDRAVMIAAAEASLRRLRTDVIDLYQIHWPTRGTYSFRQNWTYDPSGQNRAATLAHMDDILGALADLVTAGKIRSFGLSNETAWGTARWIDRAQAVGGPRVASVQNEYSLLCRFYDTDMAELAVNEDVTLLAFSPLAAGFLTGKYQSGQIPAGSRMSLSPEMSGRKSARVFDAVAAYLAIAADHGLDPVHMAMAWQRTRPFPSCPIFGATSADQLARILAGRDVVLGEDVLAAILEAHKAHPMPY
jgi:aryl-alcohol dehydrogenase-like predicted oxidoreductase